MDVTELLATIDARIAHVQEARAKIVALTDGTSTPKRKTAASSNPAQEGKRKRQLSPEGRARIAEAQRRRHAARQGNAAQAVEQEG